MSEQKILTVSWEVSADPNPILSVAITIDGMQQRWKSSPEIMQHFSVGFIVARMVHHALMTPEELAREAQMFPHYIKEGDPNA